MAFTAPSWCCSRAASSFRKKCSTVDPVLQDVRGATAHGGQWIVDAPAKDFWLWEKIRACGCMDPRKGKLRGFSPEAVVARILFSFCSGGIRPIHHQLEHHIESHIFISFLACSL